MRHILGISCLLLLTSPAWAHVRIKSPGGLDLTRNDYPNVTLQYNEYLFPGSQNALGRTMMTGDSDPIAALSEILASWSTVDGSAIRFAPPILTKEDQSPFDGLSTIVLKDTPTNRSIVGTALAVTITRYTQATGEVVDTDILFNPLSNELFGAPFATTGNANTIDFNAVLTHELGHLLGGSHSPLLGATMFYSGGTLDARQLTEDDKSLARSVSPLAGTGAYGELRGKALLPDGLPARGIFIVATDRASGVTVSSLTNSTGDFLVQGVPAGSYVVFAEPIDGPTPASAVGLSATAIDTNVEAMFVGGGDSPTVFTVGAGTAATVDFAMQPATGALDIRYLSRGRIGGTTDATSGFLSASRGETLDIMIGGTGIVDQLENAKVELVGAGARIVPGSIRVSQARNTTLPTIRFTVEITGAPRRSLVSIVYRTATAMSTIPGALVVAPAGSSLTLHASNILNAASFTDGPVAPASWVSLYADDLATQFKVSGASLATVLDGTTVQVTDGVGMRYPALLQFVTNSQLNFLMPAGAVSGPGRISVTTAKGTGFVDFTIASVAPGIFAANANGTGPAAATFLTVVPGTDAKSGLTFDVSRSPRANTPIDIGTGDTYLIFYGTGLRLRIGAVTATVDGVSVPVLAAVAQGQFQGLDQVNIGPLPPSLAGRGEVSVVFTVEGKTTNPVTVNVR